MTRGRLDIFCSRRDFSRNVEVFIRGRLEHQQEGDVVLVADPLVLRYVPYSEAISIVPEEPTILLGESDARLFMDALWEVGVRPSNGTGSAGQLAATERHLEDMRTLVFKGAEMEIP